MNRSPIHKHFTILINFLCDENGGGAQRGERANSHPLPGYAAYSAAAASDPRLAAVRHRLGPDIRLYRRIRDDFRRRAAVCGFDGGPSPGGGGGGRGGGSGGSAQ